VEVARRPAVGAVEHDAEALAAPHPAPHDGERKVEMPIPREEVVGVPHDDDEAGVLGAREHDLLVDDGVDARTRGVAVGRVVVLGGAKPAGVIPNVVAGVAVADEKAGAEGCPR